MMSTQKNTPTIEGQAVPVYTEESCCENCYDIYGPNVPNPSGSSDPSKTRCQSGYPTTPYPTTLPFDEPACCADNCADISCPNGYKRNPTPAGEYSRDACCATSCSDIQCPSAQRKSDTSGVTTFTEQECCVTDCSDYTCPSGYRKKNPIPTSGIINTGNCCEPASCDNVCNNYIIPDTDTRLLPKSQGQTRGVTDFTIENCCYTSCSDIDCAIMGGIQTENRGDRGLSLKDMYQNQYYFTQSNCCTVPTQGG